MPGRTDETSADVPMEDGAPPSHQPTAEDEFANDGQQGEEDEEDEEELEQRVRIKLPGSTDTAASFEFKAEGHTLGNALRYIIMKNPDVEFCAYSIPHPSEDLMNIRIQTYDGTAVSALSKGLKDLQGLCDVMTDEFTRERDSFAVDKMES